MSQEVPVHSVWVRRAGVVEHILRDECGSVRVKAGDQVLKVALVPPKDSACEAEFCKTDGCQGYCRQTAPAFLLPQTEG